MSALCMHQLALHAPCVEFIHHMSALVVVSFSVHSSTGRPDHSMHETFSEYSNRARMRAAARAVAAVAAVQIHSRVKAEAQKAALAQEQERVEQGRKER